MSGRGVVILTEPSRCELVDADVLVRAILEVQQLNQAGLAASQAFCDHPAAAMKFVEAYTKAYPDLQQRSPDLPPPEALQSIVAEGRVVPLQGPAASESAKLGEARQLSPLYVLSLGAPDAMLRALQNNRIAASDIQVVEITAAEDTSTEAGTVAEAVAHEPLTRLYWQGETSAELGRDDDGHFSSLELGTSDSVTLATVEVDLDHIQHERTSGQKNSDAAEPELDAAATAFPPLVSPGTGNSANPQKTSINPGDVAAPAAHLGTSAPKIETSATSPSPGVVTGDLTAPAEISPNTVTAAAAADTEPAPDAEEQSEPVSGDDVESPPAVSGVAAPVDPPAVTGDALDAHCDPDADNHADDDDLEPVEPLPTADGQMTTTSAADPDKEVSAQNSDDTDGQPFCDPGEDVVYPPSSSFAVDDDDVTYPMPPGPTPSGDLLDVFFGGAEYCEVVDLEETFDGLFGDTTIDEYDVDLMRSSYPGSFGSNIGSEPGAQTLPSAEGSEADEGSAQHERAPAVHDLDI